MFISIDPERDTPQQVGEYIKGMAMSLPEDPFVVNAEKSLTLGRTDGSQIGTLDLLLSRAP